MAFSDHMLRFRSGGARSPLLVHVLFWSVAFGFFVVFFGREARSYSESTLFVALLLPVAMATTYFTAGLLVPRFLLTKRYALFVLYGVYALIASVYLELVVLIVSFMLLAGYEIEAMTPPTLDLMGLIVALYVVVFLAVAADLARRWQRLRVSHENTERARLEAELALREAELARLKSQMQPHFLFNTLNNLYGLTLERSDDAPDVVLRLSELLDYVLYRCNGKLVPLREEIEHLQTYLDLERLRYDQRVTIDMYVDGAVPEAYIAPLMLTPFVENGFKHGASSSVGRSWIVVRIGVEDGLLRFTVENAKPRARTRYRTAGRNATPSGSQREAPPTDTQRDRMPTGSARDATPSASRRGEAPSADEAPWADEASSGIGLENVRRRLRLLYPEAHELIIEDLPDRYAVHLTVPIHPSPITQYCEVDA